MKKLVPVIAGLIIAAGSFFLGYATDAGEAFKIFTDKEVAKAYCAKLIDGE